MDSLDLSDPETDTEDLFASPPRAEKNPAHQRSANPLRTIVPPVDPNVDSEEVQEGALRRELAGVRSINEVIESVVDSLDRAKGNMDAISRTVTNASTLLNSWTRILSQTEHNQRLILNPSWQGASQDLSDLENERLLRRQEKELRLMEELQKRESAARKAAEDERRREEAASGRGNRVIRGKARGAARASSGHVGNGGQGGRGAIKGGGTIAGRASSGIGRGFSGRGRVGSSIS